MKKCSVCILDRDKRIEIDKKILQGISLKAIANEFGISSQILARHKKHVTRQLVTSEKARDMLSVEGIMGQVQDDFDDLAEIRDKANDQGQLMTAVAGIRERRGYLTLAAGLGLKLYEARKLEQEVDKPVNINVSLIDDDLSLLSDSEQIEFSRLKAKMGKVIPIGSRKKVPGKPRLKKKDRPKGVPSPVEVLEEDPDIFDAGTDPDVDIEEPEVEEVVEWIDENGKHQPGYYEGIDGEGLTWHDRQKIRPTREVAGVSKWSRAPAKGYIRKSKKVMGSSSLHDALQSGKAKVSGDKKGKGQGKAIGHRMK